MRSPSDMGGAGKKTVWDFSAYLFDLDGTLVESMGMWADIDVDYLARFGLAVPEGLQKDLEGLSYSETAVYFKRRFHIRDSLNQIKADWHEMAREKYCRLPLKEGALELIQKAHERKIRCAIASSNSGDLIRCFVDAHGIAPYFDTLTSCDEVKAGKPDPSVYLYTAEKLGIKPAECLVFEDIVLGIEAGRRAGMAVTAVEDPFSKDQEADKRNLADYYIRDYRELL